MCLQKNSGLKCLEIGKFYAQCALLRLSAEGTDGKRCDEVKMCSSYIALPFKRCKNAVTKIFRVNLASEI